MREGDCKIAIVKWVGRWEDGFFFLWLFWGENRGVGSQWLGIVWTLLLKEQKYERLMMMI